MSLKSAKTNVGTSIELAPQEAALVVNANSDEWNLTVPEPYGKGQAPRSVLFMIAMSIIWEKDEGQVDELIGQVVKDYDPSRY